VGISNEREKRRKTDPDLPDRETKKSFKYIISTNGQNQSVQRIKIKNTSADFNLFLFALQT